MSGERGRTERELIADAVRSACPDVAINPWYVADEVLIALRDGGFLAPDERARPLRDRYEYPGSLDAAATPGLRRLRSLAHSGERFIVRRGDEWGEASKRLETLQKIVAGSRHDGFYVLSTSGTGRPVTVVLTRHLPSSGSGRGTGK